MRLEPATIEAAFEFVPGLRLKYGDEAERTRVFALKCAAESAMIVGLMHELVKISKKSQVLWKNQSTSLGSISLLFGTCRLQPSVLTVECVQLLVDSLINENINVRRVATDALCIILKMVKHRKQTRELAAVELVKQETAHKPALGSRIQPEQVAVNRAAPGFRDDNAWHVYNPNFLDEEVKWENVVFLDKSFWGYYCWPSRITVNLNRRQTYALEDSGNHGVQQDAAESAEPYAECMKAVRDRFKNDAEFVRKFIQLATIEESKGQEKFDKKRFYLFKVSRPRNPVFLLIYFGWH